MVIPLEKVPVHLGLGATAVPQEPITGELEWYERYAKRNAADGTEGRLVTLHSFSKPWRMWEMHPNGSELVICIDGEITMHQEIDGQRHSVALRRGEAVVNEPGIWHTADVSAPATALFITAGLGTEHRPR